MVKEKKSKKYVVVTKQEMDAVLSKWKRHKHGKEWVYDFPMRFGITLRVYSSVTYQASRGVGQDAIRICVVDRNTNKGLRSSVKVYRVAGWQDRLKKKVMKFYDHFKKREKNLFSTVRPSYD